MPRLAGSGSMLLTSPACTRSVFEHNGRLAPDHGGGGSSRLCRIRLVDDLCPRLRLGCRMSGQEAGSGSDQQPGKEQDGGKWAAPAFVDSDPGRCLPEMDREFVLDVMA